MPGTNSAMRFTASPKTTAPVQLYNSAERVNNNISIGTLTMIGGIINVGLQHAGDLDRCGIVLSQFNPANIGMVTRSARFRAP